MCATVGTATTTRSKSAFFFTSSISEKEGLLKSVSKKIEKQISRTRTEESSPKNTSLYFSLLTETKDLVVATMNLLELYNDQYDSSVPKAEIITEEEK